jgi:hypothetical protein
MKNDPMLYGRFLAEHEEILKYKWIESEKQGYDIGFEKALTSWIKQHRKDWLEEYNKIKNNTPQNLY